MKKKKRWVIVEEFIKTIRERWDDNHANTVKWILWPRKIVLQKTAKGALETALRVIHRDSLTAGESFGKMLVRLPST